MQIGISWLNNWGIEDVQGLVDLAIRAEALGFAPVWVHDHVFNAGHVFRRIGYKPYYEPLTLLSYVAAHTERVGLAPRCWVLPYHNPIRLAKTVATLDVLSGGRLILGVGVGAVAPESEAMGSPYAERGTITDEAIAVMKALWTQEDPSFAGKYSRFSGMPFSPKPFQRPHIPVLLSHALKSQPRGIFWYTAIYEPLTSHLERSQTAGGVAPQATWLVATPDGRSLGRLRGGRESMDKWLRLG